MKKEAGFTLLEVMISMLVFAVVMAGMGPAFIAQIRHNTQSEIRTEAMGAAQIRLDQLRLAAPSTLPASGSSAPLDVAVGSRTYRVVSSFCENATFCTSVNNRHITVRVTYNDDQVFETQTVYTQLR